MSARAASRRRQRGFTIMELMVTMAIAATLMGLGVGVFTSMGKRTASDNALASLQSLIVAVRNASSRFPAAIAVDPETGAIQALAQEVRQELHFDPRVFENQTIEENGIEFRTCDYMGNQVEPTSGRVGGALTLSGGKVDCGKQAAYDVTDGLTVELWMKPDALGSADLVMKGDALKVRLESANRVTATISVQDEHGAEKVSTTAQIPTLRIGQWIGLRVSYDCSTLDVSTDVGFGWVRRGSSKSETRRLVPSPDASLTVGGFSGLLDDFRFAGVHSTEPILVPPGVKLVGTKRYSIHFLGGALDPHVHLGAQSIPMESAGRRTTLQIASNGMLTVAYAEVTPAGAAPGAGDAERPAPPKRE